MPMVHANKPIQIVFMNYHEIHVRCGLLTHRVIASTISTEWFAAVLSVKTPARGIRFILCRVGLTSDGTSPIHQGASGTPFRPPSKTRDEDESMTTSHNTSLLFEKLRASS